VGRLAKLGGNTQSKTRDRGYSVRPSQVYFVRSGEAAAKPVLTMATSDLEIQMRQGKIQHVAEVKFGGKTRENVN